MPKGKWKKCPYFAPIEIPIINIKTDGRKEPEFYFNLNLLLKVILENISRVVNYNHLRHLIKKADIPIKYEGEHFDISYIAPDRSLVLVKIKVIPYRRMPKRIREMII